MEVKDIARKIQDLKKGLTYTQERKVDYPVIVYMGLFPKPICIFS